MSNSKCLIAYYSRAGNNYVGGAIVNLPVGNTEVAAHIIQQLTDAALFKIETVKQYPADYYETTEVSKKELRQNFRPELSVHVDISEYEVIYLGYPNWWGTMPLAVFSFLEEYDFSGKTIVPFCTHEGSGLGRSESDIRRLCPAATVSRGLAIVGGSVRSAEEPIRKWLGLQCR
ncbi:flavodoxin [Geomonas sp.]|uniref:flavodoxin n=1 Tax=Geomonas sp. TaxID=2651584 RepID=UPI002B464D61|nr:flavodoxin [Geomonas sp.]HJV35869.1 flavodoxin [Geomonas sp.]